MNRHLKLLIGILIVVLGLSFAIYVNNQPSATPSTSPSPSSSSSAPLAAVDIEGCYVYSADDGTRYTLYVDASDDKNFYGFMEYNNPGFDSSRGVFIGQFRDPLLLGIYDFYAEGERSKRELAFFFEDGGFVRGYSAMEMVGDIEKFIDINELIKDYDYVFNPSTGCATN